MINMLNAVLLSLVVLLSFLGIIIWIRKTMWDAVHRNLLELEDHFEGKVIRNGFASRPVFHGLFNKIPITVNFSTERINKNRYTFIDISLATGAEHSLTLIAERWYSRFASGESSDFFKIAYGKDQNCFAKPMTQRIQQITASEILKSFLNKYPGFVYCFIGATGAIIEYQTEEIISDTGFDKISAAIEFVYELTSMIK